MSRRLRYLAAHLLDLLPGQCRADLWMWAYGHTPRTTPWSPLTIGCRLDAAKDGVCRCRKLRREAVARG